VKDGCDRDHKHRYVKVSRNSRLLRVLRKHLWYVKVDTALKSRWTWGGTHDPGIAVLTPLGILHTLAGIVVMYPNTEEGEGHERRTRRAPDRR
jgi:hypothetical protein